MEKEAHSLDSKTVIELLNSSKKGLSAKEAESRLKKYGLNEIKEKKGPSPFRIFLGQFNSPIVWILCAAVILSLAVNEYIDAAAISVLLLLNAVLGFIQEYRAEKAIDALKRMEAIKCRVIRNGIEQEIKSKYVVPGDILIIEEGSKLAADARIIENFSLETQESSLTGESTPVEKSSNSLPIETILADRKNMLYSGTDAVRGRAVAIVVSTGMNTEIGKIAKLIEDVKREETPLQKKLAKLSKAISIVTIFIAVIIFFSGIIRGVSPLGMFITSIALAVAAIPEGLPAVVTISLAIGVQRMAKRNALVRKLPSVETLGSTTVICTDKTGTLTMNEMVVKKIYVDNEIIDVYTNSKENFSDEPKDLDFLLSIGVLCNNASLNKEKSLGEPTELALLACGLRKGMEKGILLKEFERIDEIPFTSEKKFMVTIHKTQAGEVAYMKGAPDIVLERCNRILVNGRTKKIYPKDKEIINSEIESFATKALRVIGFAYKETSSKKDAESDFVFVGMQAMMDPPRPEAKDAIKKCHNAGIKVVMITGDHKLTAKAIADELGIKGDVISGDELDKINLPEVVENIAVYARVNPSHKLRIIEALKQKGHIVAMTGDGVNDAPALKEADIGIAMGITGTDVSKEASHMVLTDDNFASIVNAIEEGRSIYDNIKKFVAYLLSCNLGEVFVIFFASILGWPLPLAAIQILWVNLVTDGFPALALGMDPPSANAMSRKPRPPKTEILSKNLIYKVLLLSIMVLSGTLFLFNRYLSEGIMVAQTVAFTSLVLIEMGAVFIIRYTYHTDLLGNKKLLLAIASSIGLHLLVLYTPLARFFKVVPLSLAQWENIILVTVIIITLGILVDLLVQKFTRELD